MSEMSMGDFLLDSMWRKNNGVLPKEKRFDVDAFSL